MTYEKPQLKPNIKAVTSWCQTKAKRLLSKPNDAGLETSFNYSFSDGGRKKN